MLAMRSEHNQRYLREKQELLMKLEHLGKLCTSKDVQLNDLLEQIEREKHVISTMEARCASTQQVVESRKVAAQHKLVKHSSVVHKHEDTGLESLVKALQEEAVEIRAELADRKRSAEKIASIKEDLETTCRKLKAEVEGWKDRSAMAAGQRIVARRQLDEFSKQVFLAYPSKIYQICWYVYFTS